MAVAADPPSSTSAVLDEVRELAREHTVVPLRHTFIDDSETPVSAYLKLRGDGPSFLLESAEQGQRFGRWSFLGVQPRTVIRSRRRLGGGERATSTTRTPPSPRSSSATASRRSPACRRSRAARSACSATTSCAARADRRRAEPGRRSACPTWR